MTAANEALSTDTPATVTFDTLSAAQELRKTGFEDRQAEAVVTTISKAMSETVATKADLQLVRSDFELLRSDFKLLRSEFESLRQYVDSRLDALENRLILKLGGSDGDDDLFAAGHRPVLYSLGDVHNDRVRLISAREMARKERKDYEEI